MLPSWSEEFLLISSDEDQWWDAVEFWFLYYMELSNYEFNSLNVPKCYNFNCSL